MKTKMLRRNVWITTKKYVYFKLKNPVLRLSMKYLSISKQIVCFPLLYCNSSQISDNSLTTKRVFMMKL